MQDKFPQGQGPCSPLGKQKCQTSPVCFTSPAMYFFFKSCIKLESDPFHIPARAQGFFKELSPVFFLDSWLQHNSFPQYDEKPPVHDRKSTKATVRQGLKGVPASGRPQWQWPHLHRARWGSRGQTCHPQGFYSHRFEKGSYLCSYFSEKQKLRESKLELIAICNRFEMREFNPCRFIILWSSSFREQF